MNTFFQYLGYGFVSSKKARNEVDIKSTKAYKTLRAAFLDSITIEVADPASTTRTELHQIISRNFNKTNIVIVVPTVETLGGTYDDAVSTYCQITERFHIIILNRPNLSTCTLNGEVLVELYDTNARSKLQSEITCARMTTRGRKSLPIDEKFRRVFWEWQNYHITTNAALELLNCSRGTLYSISKEFMTSSSFSEIYLAEYDKLFNYEQKPVRGITLDKYTNELLIKIQRNLGDYWSFNDVLNILSEEPMDKRKFHMPADYIRLRLNYLYGRAAMVSATQAYSKGKKYVEFLRKELEYM